MTQLSTESFACDFIAQEILESKLPFHDHNFCKFRVPYTSTSDAYTLETRQQFMSERGKKKESWNQNPGLTAWVMNKFEMNILPDVT